MVENNKPKEFKCEHCGKVYYAPQALGIHKRTAHNIVGASTTAKHMQMSKHRGMKPKIGRPKGSKTKNNVKERTTQIVKSESTQNAEIIETTNHHIETAVAIAIGRITELLHGVAIQYDVPPRTFAAYVIRNLGQTPKIR